MRTPKAQVKIFLSDVKTFGDLKKVANGMSTIPDHAQVVFSGGGMTRHQMDHPVYYMDISWALDGEVK